MAATFAVLLKRRLMAEPSFLEGVDVMVPVPLHASRMGKRGFNQSSLIAGEVSVLCGIPVNENILGRIRDTRPQVGLTARERAENIRNAFEASREAGGMVILLVDDVMTTGATVSACARALKAAGAEETRVLTLARD